MRWILWGLAGVLAVAGLAVAVRALRSDGSRSTITTAAVTRAFAARGIALEADPDLGLAPGLVAHVEGILWNRPRASSEGVVIVIVTRSTAEARALSAHQMAPTTRDVCGETTAKDFRTWQSRNVVASLSSCDYIDGAMREATAPANATVSAVMGDIAR